MTLPREDWIRALTAHSTTSLLQLAAQLSTDCTVTPTRLPQAGLGLLKLADGAFQEPFYLGEFPLASCSVELGLPDGRRAQGGAQVMADDAELARALAILDAKFPGWDVVTDHVQSGSELRAEEARRRRAILNETRVDFALLSNSAEDADAE
jgi:alpha-D-ribose 1-methylphosphonate 5-triphosphate synthase subunit PhnG